MRASELSIGCIIIVNGEPRRVRTLTRRKVGHCSLKNPVILQDKISDCEAIAITEELLLKNGFKHEYDEICEFNYYIKEIDDCFVDVQIECANKGNDYVVCHIDNADRCSIASADIRYLHQMQNLLNTIGIEWKVTI